MIETDSIMSIILSVITTGGLTTFLFLPQLRKSKNIDNESKQSDEWRKLYEEASEEATKKDNKIEELYSEISKHRDEKASLQKEVSRLTAENTRLETSLKYLKCEKPGCPNRTPPTGY